MPAEERARARRNALVDELVAAGAIRSKSVEKAMRTVARHELLRDIWIPSRASSGPGLDMSAHSLDGGDISDELLGRIYSDVPIVTKMTDSRARSSTSQPSLVAQMLQFLDLQPGIRVLEIGAGTCYNAALMAELVGRQELITTIDIAPDVAEQTRHLLARSGYRDITVICADGALGHPEAAPYDRIVATVGCSDIAPAWLQQLTADGFLLIPLAHFTLGHPLIEARPLDAGGAGRVVAPAGFMPIEGALEVPLNRGSAGVSRGEPRRTPVPAEIGALAGAWDGPLWDFLYFLGLADDRAGPGLMLADPEGSVRVDLRAEELLETGDSGRLRDELLAYVATWNELGRPKAGDWRSTFVPLDTPRASVYRIDRIHYAQIATLP